MSLNSIKINTNDTNYTHSIFDISEYTRRQYEDLSSALADVPTEKQSGGMTIRYIQTSDNKYVQYRLMSDTFNTNVDNWQGVDDEPTIGSENLIKSGGVCKVIDEINLEINKYSSGVANRQCKNEPKVRYHIDIPAGDYTYIGRGEQWAVVNFYKNGLLVYTLNNGNIAAVGVEYNFTLQDSVDEIGAYVGGTQGENALYGFDIINKNSILNILKQHTDNIEELDDVITITLKGKTSSYGSLNPWTVGEKVLFTGSSPYKLQKVTAVSEQGVVTGIEDIPFSKGVYILNNELYIWNGSDLVNIEKEKIVVLEENVTKINDKIFDPFTITTPNSFLNGITGYYFDIYEGTTTGKAWLKGGEKYSLIADGEEASVYRIAFYTGEGTGFIEGTNSQYNEFTAPSTQERIYVIVALSSVVTKFEIVNKNTILARLSNLEKENVKYADTNIVVWVGTSIPESATYPQKSCKANGYECINNSLGSSRLRFISKHPAKVDRNSGRELTATVSELEALYRQDVTAGTITNDELENWKNHCYERAIIPYIDGTNPKQASMIVVDHGYNDRAEITTELENEADIDWESTDRSTFHGAFRYLINKIQEVNPFVKIVIGGYFSNTLVRWYNSTLGYGDQINAAKICRMQELLAEKYNISIVKVWEDSQIANYYVSGSSDYISDFNTKYSTNYNKLVIYDENMVQIPNPDGNISALQLYCPDGIHPHTDLTGNCNKRLNAIWSRGLRKLI